MSTIRFRTGNVDLELKGSEEFVLRQLRLLASSLGAVDVSALNGAAAPEPEAAPAEPPAEAALPPEAEPVAQATPPEGGDELIGFFRSVRPVDRDPQVEAALSFSYYLQRRQGAPYVRTGDLLLCCARAGVDSRNFHRALGVLTRRGFLAPGPGPNYHLTDQGAASVEERIQ